MNYERYYQEYSDEVHKVLGSYFLWRMIHNRSFEEPDLLDAMNDTPLSWILIRHSLQVTLFMTLGRIFDIDGDAFSIDDLLKCCIEEKEVFSKDNLRARKMEECNGKEPDWLEEYIEDSDEITELSFRMLRGEVSKFRRIFEHTYQPIRHKLFAHADKLQMGKRDELWQKTNIGELESILWFLNDVKDALFNAYFNGVEPSLKGVEPDIGFYERDFSLLLDNVREA